MTGLLLPVSLPAQVPTVEVRGTVTDGHSREAVTGASVTVRNDAKSGAVTDADGHFHLPVASLPATLVVNHLGYKPQEIEVYETGEPVTIYLMEDYNLLNEIVVVGYGTQKRQDLIGSVTQISSERLAGKVVGQLSNALTGELTGVTVIQRSGKPGADGGEIRVRGVGSFGASPDALVLIDGIPGTLNNVQPDDVETLSVLKDASSAAIYGARAANGVILVTTKKGRAGRIKINYSATAGWQNPTAFPERAASWEYAEMYNESYPFYIRRPLFSCCFRGCEHGFLRRKTAYGTAQCAGDYR
jgi:TonB-dependent SusC/RagA subfamily outer membrane receptor